MKEIPAPQVLDLSSIEQALRSADLIAAMEMAFAAYSRGLAVVPPVAELQFSSPPGECHIKYGYMTGGDIFVVKIATGFYDNPSRGLPSGSGMIVAFDLATGMPSAVLLDQGRLTDLRTAAAGAVAAKYLAPKKIDKIGLIGGGVQARLQMKLLKEITSCRTVAVWARRPEAARELAADLGNWGFDAVAENSPAEACRDADLVITTTASTTPLVDLSDLKPGAHVTAVGSDTADKQELSSSILKTARRVVVDSRAQAQVRGEVHKAIIDGWQGSDAMVELGEVIEGSAVGRRSDDELTVADLTGVAVQDIMMAKMVLEGAKGLRDDA